MKAYQRLWQVYSPMRRCGIRKETGAKLAKGLGPRRISNGVPRWHDGGPASMPNTKITSLDRRLYAWLGESDDGKFERAFNAYFSIAFPAVIRHLMRISRWDPIELEEVAQDALHRFFDRLGRGRREASQSVELALRRVRPLRFGLFHERQVNNWTSDVASFRNAAMGFRLAEIDDASEACWKESIRAIADRIPVLRQQGCHILYTVRLEINWGSMDELPAESLRADAEDRSDPDIDEMVDTEARASYAAAKAFANGIVAETAAHSFRAQTAVEKHPRLVQFVDGAFVIVGAIPRLRVPTNGYLFEIAMTIYLDECKKRGRKKRGGGGSHPSESSATSENVDRDSQHPLEMLTLETEATFDGEEYFEGAASSTARDKSVSAFATPAVDPTPQYENEDLFAKFYEYLRKPIADATQAYENAVGTARAQAERQKLESLTKKFTRTTAVLSLMGEGYTQEQIAEQLALSRNQVKYIVESVQEAYARFAADSVQYSTRASRLREESNAG
jgi:DNA-directed RNA polymerase specialized sigma24 family protein